MKKMWLNWKAVFNVLMITSIVFGLGMKTAYAAPTDPAVSQVWSFGVLPDTQWTMADDGFNPNTIAVNNIMEINKQFINAGVKFVVSVGDQLDNPKSNGVLKNVGVRALYAQDLYNAGIGYFPLRGNHEAAEGTPVVDTNTGAEMLAAFPQMLDGVNNNTPATITTADVYPQPDLVNVSPAAKTGSTFTVGSNFTQPAAVNTANNAVSYAFQYNNATFVLLDQFDVNSNYYNSTIPDQQTWINTNLSTRPTNTHAFVFAHKNLLGGNHKDNLFGGWNSATDPIPASTDPGDGNVSAAVLATYTDAEKATVAAKQTAMDNFITSMQANNVDYFISGHDHQHDVSVVTSPLSNNKVRQIIGQSASSKFYTPANPVSSKEAPVQQDLFKVGYYIFTVDGPRVTVDYYADMAGGFHFGGEPFNFVKVSSLHYSLNGTEKLVPATYPTTAYAITDNTTKAATLESGFKGTSMAILAGSNGSSNYTNYGKLFNNDVFTSWKPGLSLLFSDILTLSGMSRTLGSPLTDKYVLSMTYTADSSIDFLIDHGVFSILSLNDKGQWVNAVKKNVGAFSTRNFVLGPWNSSYALGTYGVDRTTNTAWAVINYNGDFSTGVSYDYFNYMPTIYNLQDLNNALKNSLPK